MIDPNSEPLAHDLLVPIPLNWRAAVEEGLDWEFRSVFFEEFPWESQSLGAIAW